MTDKRSEPTLPRRRLLRTASAAATVALAGCQGGGDENRDASSDAELTVFHKWADRPGSYAIDGITGSFEVLYPDIESEFVAHSGDASYDVALRERLDGDDPPSSFACRAGRTLERYRDHLGAVGDDVWWGIDRSDVSVPEVRDLCRYEGEQVAVPIGSYRTNHLFYNAHVLDAAGVDPATLGSVTDLIDALERVATDSRATPMAHSPKRPRATLRLFAAVLLGQAGYASYTTFVDGEGGGDAVRSALETTATILSNYVSDDAATITPVEAIDSFAADEAAFLQQGTWAPREFPENGFAYGEDWGSVPFPGTEGTFTLHLDSFVYAVDDAGENPSPQATDTWLRYLVGAQRLFNGRRDSIPTRTDVRKDLFPPFLRETIGAFRNADRRPPSLAHGLAVAPGPLSEMESVVEKHFTGPFDVGATAEGLLDVVEDP